MEDYISVAEYAKAHNISKQTVYNYIEEGRVVYKAYKRGKTTGYLIQNDEETDGKQEDEN